MGTSRAYILFITVHLIYVISAQEMVKRVPQGFVGMRGKKYSDVESLEQFYKRKPQFFVGVKGKKNMYDYLETPDYYYKRAHMGFVGMRGKKDDPIFYPENEEYVLKRGGSLIGQIDYSTSDDPKNLNEPDFPLLNELLASYLQKLERANSIEVSNSVDSATESMPESMDTNERISNEVDKRANIHQFFGVRGKKSIQAKRPYDLSFRGKFIGVRGKKDLRNSPQEIKFLMDHSAPWAKRKGFFGMRGKKWIDESNSEMESN